MIRFIDVGKQYWGEAYHIEDDPEYREEFSFIDTVVDKYVTVNGNQYWNCWDDFADDYESSGGWDDRVAGGKMPLERFRCLIDEKFVRDSFMV